jgi:hypothetical protein
MLALLWGCSLLFADMPAAPAGGVPAPGGAPIAAASQPASQPVTVELRLRVAIGSKKGSMLDPRLADLYGSLKDFVYTSYSVKEDRTLSVELHGQTKISLPENRTVILTVKEYKPKGRPRVRVRIEIPELKFATETTIGSGGTLVVGGPKVEDGVLLFAVGVTKLTPH